MIWGSMTHTGALLLKVKGSLNSEKYLKSEIEYFILQQDNAIHFLLNNLSSSDIFFFLGFLFILEF